MTYHHAALLHPWPDEHGDDTALPPVDFPPLISRAGLRAVAATLATVLVMVLAYRYGVNR